MSRFGDEDPHAFDDPHGPDNAECADCGAPWYRAPLDSCPWCGDCAIRRDEWATAQEIKRMAKVVLAADLMTIKDIA